jgi:hypothetical protein
MASVEVQLSKHIPSLSITAFKLVEKVVFDKERTQQPVPLEEGGKERPGSAPSSGPPADEGPVLL